MTREEVSQMELPYALHTLTEELPAHSEIEHLLIQPNRILGDYPKWWQEMCSNSSLEFKTNYAAAFTKWWHENH